MLVKFVYIYYTENSVVRVTTKMGSEKKKEKKNCHPSNDDDDMPHFIFVGISSYHFACERLCVRCEPFVFSSCFI